jgi:hypothetical protein
MITRENLQNGWLARLAEVAGGHGEAAMIRTEDELTACRQAALGEVPAGEDVWVFAYGSLIWNPAFHFVGGSGASGAIIGGSAFGPISAAARCSARA